MPWSSNQTIAKQVSLLPKNYFWKFYVFGWEDLNMGIFSIFYHYFFKRNAEPMPLSYPIVKLISNTRWSKWAVCFCHKMSQIMSLAWYMSLMNYCQCSVQLWPISWHRLWSINFGYTKLRLFFTQRNFDYFLKWKNGEVRKIDTIFIK